MCAMYQADVYRVLIASPSDLAEERNIATDAVHEWNAQNSAAEAVVLLPVKWETHSMPQAGIRPQEAINRQFALSPEVRALDEEDFSLHSHGVIFKRMMGLADSKEGIDFVTLTEELRRHLELEAVGGVAYVTSLTDGLPRVREIEPYIRIVTLMSKERKRRQ